MKKLIWLFCFLLLVTGCQNLGYETNESFDNQMIEEQSHEENPRGLSRSGRAADRGLQGNPHDIISELEAELDMLSSENEDLQQENSQLENQLETLQAILDNEEERRFEYGGIIEEINEYQIGGILWRKMSQKDIEGLEEGKYYKGYDDITSQGASFLMLINDYGEVFTFTTRRL